MPGLRVIAGEAKGRKLRMVPGQGTRPISDRVKESLFGILSGEVEGARFLDLFAGTGSVGIEALSRGATWATFVDSSGRAVATLRANLEATRMADRAEVVRADVFRYLARPAGDPYDLIYLAPPQYAGLWLRTLQAIDSAPAWLVEGGQAIAQMHPKEWSLPDAKNLEMVDERRYGSTLLAFFERTRS
ncbi:MAG: 16S rRNA (guanine(966)-N(2))-methyltransferase RsmD [Anaerolineales bacterium]